jgi:hypothetical protein
MAEDTWESRALPLLEALADIETTAPRATLAELEDRTGIPVAAIDVELERLVADRFIAGTISRSFGPPGSYSLIAFHLLERGSRAVGQWPSDSPYEALLTLLEERIDDPHVDDDTRTADPSTTANFRGPGS